MAIQRLFILNKLLENEPIIVVTHTMAIKRLTPSVSIFKQKTINLKVSQEHSLNHIIYELVKNGYKNVYKVTQPFEFSTRGGVIDIFSINFVTDIKDTSIVISIASFIISSSIVLKSVCSYKLILGF